MAYTMKLDREGWLIEAGNLISETLIYPVAGGTKPPQFRVSVGFSRKQSKRSIAVCFKREVSSDNTSEIFVNPELDNSREILAALTHELIHAYDDCESGHRGFFSRTAKRVGLLAPMTATTANDALERELDSIIELLGPIPHAKMDRAKIKKQATKMLKCQCSACGFTFRTTQTWINGGLEPFCIACGDNTMLFNC